MANSVGKIEIKFDLKQLKAFDNELRKMSNYSELISIGLLEMANMTSKLNETTVTGVVKNKMVVLDTDFNGGKSFIIPKGYFFNNGDKVLVTFGDNRAIAKIKLQDSVKVEKEVKNEPRKKLIPEHGFYVTEDQQRVLDVASKAFNDENNPYNGFIVSLRGDAGYGKTSLAQHFAHVNQLPILIIDCSTISDNESWFLTPGFKNHETVFEITKFTEFLTNGNCVILFDEINRMPSYISNALLPVLDHRRSTSLRGIDIKVGNKIAFFMTSNHGYSYTGTNPIDKAIKRRVIGTINVGALPALVESELLETRLGIDYSVAAEIVKVFTRLRESELKDYPVNISTGTSLNVAFWVKYGLSIREAVQMAILNDAPEESHKIILDSLNTSGQF